MIESLEQTKRLIFEVKQKQRDEIERLSHKLSDVKDTDLAPFGHDFFRKDPIMS